MFGSMFRLLSLSGRMRRRHFWIFYLIMYFVIPLVIGLIVFVGAEPLHHGKVNTPDFARINLLIMNFFITYMFANFILALIMLWVTFTAAVKRLHDREKSAWYLILLIIISAVIAYVGIISGEIGRLASLILLSFVNIWLFIELFFLEGTWGSNKYGPDPKNNGKSKKIHGIYKKTITENKSSW